MQCPAPASVWKQERAGAGAGFPPDGSEGLAAEENLQENTGPIILTSSLAQRLQISARFQLIEQFQVLDGHHGCHGLTVAGHGRTFTGKPHPVDDLSQVSTQLSQETADSFFTVADTPYSQQVKRWLARRYGLLCRVTSATRWHVCRAIAAQCGSVLPPGN